MASRIENLGDYNRVRMDLQLFGGDREALYNCVGDIAVEKAFPKHLLMGAIIGIAGMKLFEVGVNYWIERKRLLKREPEIKSAFVETISPTEEEKENELTEVELREG